ncbi:MAG TPA: hypothetical protein VHC97_08150 [Thermoanaerobaculia bacterium]|nr:hypothetical protein [Thermoanaerobaculia bacterium]
MAIVFWEGNDAQQDGWPVSTEITKTYDLTTSGQPVPNDEARSCSLVDVSGGTVIDLYNSPSGDPDKGWTRIEVKTDLTSSVVIGSFQTDQITANYVVDYNGKGELDGKVSLIKIAAG